MERLTALLKERGAELPPEAPERLARYRDLLIRKNRLMDLTSVPDGEIPLRHFYDSLAPLLEYPDLFRPGASLADVGTGAGFPGLPAAIVRTDLRVTLIESMRRRCDFLEEVRESLGLGNVTVLCARAEDAGRDGKLRESFDLTVSRAVAAAPVLLEYLLPLTKTGGLALCWKGPGAAREAEEAREAARLLGCPALTVLPVAYPGEERYLLKAEKTEPTPARYPRRTGIPAKRPLGGTKPCST